MESGIQNRVKPRGRYIDFHTHILPKMDDGSDSVEMSLEMIRLSAKQGTACIVMTPHFYPLSDYPGHFLEKRSRQFSLLMSHRKSPFPLLIPGAEVQYYDGITGMRELAQMRIGKSPALLIEMPFCEWSSRMIGDVLEINSRNGFRVILAHIERYLPFVKESTVQQMVREGVLVQSNAGFFTGFLSSARAVRMVNEGIIHLIGTDCHNLTSRAPNLAQAFSVIGKKCGHDAVKEIVRCGKDLLLAEAADASELLEEIPL